MGMKRLVRDMETCSHGNRIAIEAVLGGEIKQYQCADFIEPNEHEEAFKELQ